MTRKTNRLAGETSPYLLQHAHNPVDWYPWGPEALERAAREDKPIFLSIGYAACHWCHVMERESFENDEIAGYLNEHFVAIKVDREERPDIDDIYMAATLAISGSGGWPMSVFLSPDQRPFFAGTYFPPADRYGRPGFPSLLRRIVELWQNERAAIGQQATELTRYVLEQSAAAPALAIDGRSIDRAVMDLDRTFDERFGGFGAAPKFPPHQSLLLLLRHHRRTGDARSLLLATKTLDCMKNGGIYDHVGGGFARYSTDEQWLVPHFEKMLYDNAQLAIAYLEAFQVTQDPEYRRVATETLDYVIREMQSPEGGYYSATDADSEGEEGKFFVFLPEEIDDILGKDEAEAFCLYYDISVGGNWEGKNVLHTPATLERVAEQLGRPPSEVALELAAAKGKVYAARSKRVPPLLDDKILTAWNGLMVAAMAEGHRLLADPRYLESAERAAGFVVDKLSTAGFGLLRTIRGERAHITAFLEDYAYFGDALVSLFETSGDPRWLEQASVLAERMIESFGDAGGAFFHTPREHEQLIARPRAGHDGALPNPNAVAARLLVRLSHHFDRAEWRDRAIAAITEYGQSIERAPRAFATTLNLVDLLLEGPTELVVVGAPPARQELLANLARTFLPNRVVALVDPERPLSTPLTAGKTEVDGHAALYVCRNFTCQAPITASEDVDAALFADRSSRERAKSIDPHTAG